MQGAASPCARALTHDMGRVRQRRGLLRRLRTRILAALLLGRHSAHTLMMASCDATARAVRLRATTSSVTLGHTRRVP